MRTGRAIGLLAILAAGWAARGDLVYFARGGQAQLPATVEGQAVRLDTPDGPRSFPIGDVLALVPEPVDEGARLFEAATREGTAEARFAAFWWALENGQTPRAVAALKEARDPGSAHGPTRRALRALERLTPPCPDPDLASLRDRLRPARFQEARGDHVLLLHQGREPEALERLDVLERVVSTYYLGLAVQGVELTPLRERIVSVWFAERDDYRAFLRRVDAEPFLGTQGYYHPTLGVVLAFDTRGDEPQKTGRRALANLREGGASESDLARRALLLDLEWRAVDLGIAAHETIHQLSVASGLTPRLDDFPNWLHEGLAAQYEVIRGGRWAGFGRVNDLRLPDWRAIRPVPWLTPLLRDTGMTRGYQRDRYAESWALVYFLRKARPDQFRAFLDLLRAPSPGASAHPERAVDAFRSIFGPDFPGLEIAWRRYVNGLKTPLEAGRPPGTSRAESRLARPVGGH